MLNSESKKKREKESGFGHRVECGGGDKWKTKFQGGFQIKLVFLKLFPKRFGLKISKSYTTTALFCILEIDYYKFRFRL